jgi:hypothetical protein
MMASSAIPLENRRILGAAIPYENVAYFLKATDTVARLQAVESELRSVVERFDVDVQNREFKFSLPEGWTAKWRDGDVAFAEFNVQVPNDKPIQFTVTELSKPSDVNQWRSYLLGNINRWRGQLQLPETTLEALDREIPVIPRMGHALPGYIFDGRGSANATGENSSPVVNIPTNNSPPNSDKLGFDKPDGWEAAPARPPRLASFRFKNGDRAGEVSVVKANNAPLENAKMWYQQIVQNATETSVIPLAEKAVQEAEDVQAVSGSGKLYSIRSAENAADKGFLIAALPTSESECLFVKVTADLQSLDEQKPNLLRFINSLRWE